MLIHRCAFGNFPVVHVFKHFLLLYRLIRLSVWFAHAAQHAPLSLTHFRSGVTELSIMLACAEFASDNEVSAELGHLASLVATFGAGGAVQALSATLRAMLAKKP
jgi:hypothetical protein